MAFPVSHQRPMIGSSGWRLLKVTAALFAGAFAGALATALLVIVADAFPRAAGGTAAFVPSNLLFAYFVFWFTAPAALVVGFPSFYLLTRYRALNTLSVSAVGIVAGAGVGTLLRLGMPSGGELLTCAGIGLVSALAALMLLRCFGPAEDAFPEEEAG